MDASVLVTGATGFVLSHVAERLAAQGAQVVALDVSPPPAPVEELWRRSARGLITFVRADVRDDSALRKILTLHRVESVVHGAAIIPDPSLGLLDPRPVLEVGIAGTAAMFRASLTTGVRRIVYVSSASIYVPGDDDGRITPESAPTRTSGLYPLIKLAGEWLAREAARSGRLRAVVARLAAGYGPLERDTGTRTAMSPVWHAVRLARAGRPIVLDHPNHALDFTHARDLADGILLLVQSATLAHDVYNVGSGRAVSCRQVADLAVMAAAAGQPEPADSHPPNVSMPLDSRHGVLDISRIQSDTGYAPAFDIRQGIADYVRWLRDNAF